MNYSNADFLRLMDEVENQHGEHLEDICGGQEYSYEMPDGSKKTHFTAGCENESMFHVGYDPYATVMVPEPVLEPDPTRDGRSHRAKKDDDGNPIIVLVERKAEILLASKGVLAAARVCAGHDNLGSWPRFRHVIKDGPQR